MQDEKLIREKTTPPGSTASATWFHHIGVQLYTAEREERDQTRALLFLD